jgi:hypothetical protein
MANPEFIFGASDGASFKLISDNGTIKEIKMNDDGNITIEGAELERNSTKYEVTNINEESTTSSSYKDCPNCTVSNLKAGTYFVVFSCVGRNSNANGFSYVVLNKGGSDIPHTERRMQGNKESSISTVAVITVNGSEDIKIRFRRDSKGSAEISNANLVAVRLGD